MRWEQTCATAAPSAIPVPVDGNVTSAMMTSALVIHARSCEIRENEYAPTDAGRGEGGRKTVGLEPHLAVHARWLQFSVVVTDSSI